MKVLKTTNNICYFNFKVNKVNNYVQKHLKKNEKIILFIKVMIIIKDYIQYIFLSFFIIINMIN